MAAAQIRLDNAILAVSVILMGMFLLFYGSGFCLMDRYIR